MTHGIISLTQYKVSKIGLFHTLPNNFYNTSSQDVVGTFSRKGHYKWLRKSFPHELNHLIIVMFCNFGKIGYVYNFWESTDKWKKLQWIQNEKLAELSKIKWPVTIINKKRMKKAPKIFIQRLKGKF